MLERLLNVCRALWTEARYYLRRVFKPRVVRNKNIYVTARHPAISDYMRDVLYRDVYEVPELRTLARTLDPEDRVLEIGGGVGFISAFLARTCGNDNVLTVEANPVLAPLIATNHRLNGVAPKVINAAVGLGETVEFSENEHFWAGSTAQAGEKTIQIPAIDINGLIRDFSPTFLTMDIEGAETSILPAVADFHTVKKMMIEIHPQFYGLNTANDVLSHLLSAGFIMDFKYSAANQIFVVRQ